MVIERLTVTDSAKEVIDKLRARHGGLMFHQSGGCCDGSAPMCLAEGDFKLGARDLYLGEIHGCKFYMASDQFKYYRNMQLTVDVSEGRGASFSLEIPLGVRFMTVSRVLTTAESENIRDPEPATSF